MPSQQWQHTDYLCGGGHNCADQRREPGALPDTVNKVTIQGQLTIDAKNVRQIIFDVERARAARLS